MDNFNDIIKQKVEQFEVPYNEAHWAEMDGKLNSIRSAKIKKNIFGSAAVVAVVALSSYFILPDTNINKIDAVDVVDYTISPITTNTIKTENSTTNNGENNVSEVVNESVIEENNSNELIIESPQVIDDKVIDNSTVAIEKKSTLLLPILTTQLILNLLFTTIEYA